MNVINAHCLDPVSNQFECSYDFWCSVNTPLVSEVEVYDALVSLNPNKAMGVDCIYPKVLKTCAIVLYLPIHHLCSLCTSQHKLPEEWKIHTITPIFKSCDMSNVKNYRLISLLCCI